MAQVLTSATAEPIQPGRIARCCIGVRGLVPCKIESLGRAGSIHVRPLNTHEPRWDEPKRVTRDDVYFLLTDAEVRDLELPQ